MTLTRFSLMSQIPSINCHVHSLLFKRCNKGFHPLALHIPHSFIMLLALSIVLVSIGLFWWIWTSRCCYRRLPPGRTGLPLIGETLQLFSAYKSSNPEPFIDERVRRYGSVFTSHILGKLTIFSADPEVNRFILQNEGKLFDCNYPSTLSKLLGKHSLLLMKGGLHKKMHSFTLNFFNSSAMKDHLLRDIDSSIQKNMSSWPEKIVLMEESKKISFELIVKQLLSLGPSEWTENLRKQYCLLIDGFFSLPVPFMGTTFHKAMKARSKVANELLGVVRERRKWSKPHEGRDVLGAILERGDLHTDEEIVDYLLSLLVGGFETTSSIITLAVKFLTDCPTALAQLTEEHDAILEEKHIEWPQYKSMAFTQCVVNETLRMANIVGGVFRRTLADVNVHGYIIPKGCTVFASFRAVHMNVDYFDEAQSFNPWRWENGNNGRMSRNMFMPFGGGVRLCPGYELAKVSLGVFLLKLTRCFRWNHTEDDSIVFFPTTRTNKGYPINLIPRCKKESKKVL